MPYLKAEAVLPPELLSALQEYVQGTLVYVPRPASGRLGWGRKNGARLALDERNEAIRRAKAQGASIDDLADLYRLSTDGIRKVLYGPKKSPARNEGEGSRAEAITHP